MNDSLIMHFANKMKTDNSFIRNPVTVDGRKRCSNLNPNTFHSRIVSKKWNSNSHKESELRNKRKLQSIIASS